MVFTIHELVASVATFVSLEEVEVSLSSAVMAQLSYWAVQFFMPWVVAQALSAPSRDVSGVIESLLDSMGGGWWYGQPLEEAL